MSCAATAEPACGAQLSDYFAGARCRFELSLAPADDLFARAGVSLGEP